ncbi:RHS repeat domain-containing protein [Muribaculum intestinale]|uniref:RHS repeat domain-containing protein n=2 Tax=Muribaculum intestinale TaxID=1796646 RepID=UPI0025A98F1F|nr:RHS repeat-associated core domain-containing protein [Muribaculum intestinale]
MNAKTTYYLRFVIMLLMSIVVNCGYASVTSVYHDVNNRPHRIRFSDGGETRYIYGLDGVKRRAEHVIPGIPPVVSIGAAVSGATVTSTTDYSGAFVYEDGLLERIHLDCGYLSYRDFSGRRLTEPEYHFYQRDHLGNNRVDLCSDGSVSQITHYYPFGLPMSMGYSPESQRWKFGNKELDRINGLDLYDFEARAYDPATIRFYRPDDLADKYHSISPYVYCLNNPLIKTDSSGKYVESLWDIASMAIGVYSFVDNVSQGYVGAALVDAGGILLDAAATALPGVPGGAGAGIKAYRAGKSVAKLATTAISEGQCTTDVIEKEEPKSENEVDESLKKSELRNETSNSDIDISSAVVQYKSHTKNARGSTSDKHTATRSEKTYGEARNNKRGDKNKKYQKTPNPNKRKK